MSKRHHSPAWSQTGRKQAQEPVTPTEWDVLLAGLKLDEQSALGSKRVREFIHSKYRTRFIPAKVLELVRGTDEID